MNRRRLIASAGAGIAVALCGCSTSTEFDPEVEPKERLGAASRVSMDVTAEKDFRETDERSFEEWATRRAAEHAGNRLRTILSEESLTGPGVDIMVGTVDLQTLDPSSDTEPPTESDFKRAVDIGPLVFHYRHYSRDGELLSKPDVEFQAIVDTTPRSFEVTMNYPEESYVAILPAMCRRGWIQND